MEKIITRTERFRIKQSDEYCKTVDELSWKVKNLYNYANYIVRQKFITTSKQKEEGLVERATWIRYKELWQMCMHEEPFKTVGSSIGQSTLRLLDQNWKSYFASIKDWSKNPEKYTGKPKMPRYLDKEKGRFVISINNNNIKIVDGYVRFSYAPLKPLNGIFKSRYPDGKPYSSRIVPHNGEYTLEVIHRVEVPQIIGKTRRIASIDLGINNLMTVVTNCGVSPIVINGKPLKSINRYYNKLKAEEQSKLKLKTGKDTSNKICGLTNKRNNKVDTYIHTATKRVIEYCKANEIDTLVCGYNDGWKQEVNMGKKNNQKFVTIPYLSIIQKLEYKCQDAGILFVKTTEEYTSGTSFLDGEKPIEENYNKSRRKYRGLFVSNNGTEINADVNGAYQIMKKAFPDAYDKVKCDYSLHPVVITVPSKVY